MKEDIKLFSNHNIFSPIHQSKNWFIANLLTSNADILSEEEAIQIQDFLNGKSIPLELEQQMFEKQYLIGEQEEKILYNKKYLEFIDARDSDEIQIFYVLSYDCNFKCSYCYQSEYDSSKKPTDLKVIDSFFDYIHTEFAGRPKYLTLFGGEPLLPGELNKENVKHFLDKAKEFKLETAIVTNGYTLVEFIDVIKNYKLREIQVTLDGTEKTHNIRRKLKNGNGSFEKIVAGIDACLIWKIPVNLRMVVDRENLDELPKLVKFAIDKKWTSNPLFKTQIGRNYELHSCQSSPNELFSRIELYHEIFKLIHQYPHIIEFHKPAFSFAKFLFENEKLPDPLFDSCPACKTEWAFDYTGKIYGCTATVGKNGEHLGFFFPYIKKLPEKITEWENRDIRSIAECKNCSVQLACGGGCGAVAKNTHGQINKPDCRPIKELLKYGFKLYNLE